VTTSQMVALSHSIRFDSIPKALKPTAEGFVIRNDWAIADLRYDLH
jgi:hypothetical protein